MSNPLLLDKFIRRSKEKYGDQFNYSLSVYDKSHTKIILVCKNNHTFTTTPSTHLSKLSKGGCKQCYLTSKPVKYTQESIIPIFEKIHNHYYDYSKSTYKDLQTKMIIICRTHGEFMQTPFSHLYGKKGCNECGRIKTLNSHVLSKEQIQQKFEKFKRIHNNKYTYVNVYRENNILWLEFICPKHGSHITRFFNHEKGHGCPNCVRISSNVQIQWLEYRAIRDGFIQHIQNIGEYIIPNTKYSVDGYNKETNTIYEFQGDFWHGNPNVYDQNKINTKVNCTFGELYINTLNKINLLKNKGYRVVEIWEYDWRKAIKMVKKIQRVWRKYRLQKSM